jgi:membrane protease YdiL (CAAX protease family)
MRRSLAHRPEVDVALMTALLLSYLWLWHGSFPGDFFVCVALYFAIGAWSQWKWNETTSEIGIRVDNFGPAFGFGMMLVAPIALVAVALGSRFGTIEPPKIDGLTDVSRSLAWGVSWATLQQYGLVCVYYRRLKDLLGGHWGATLAAAGLFATLHLPNPFLVPVTFVGGIIACQIYRRSPNVFVLGLLHLLLSLSLRISFGPEITHHMRVGPGYWNV